MPIRVLIADDHAIVRDGLRALLASNPEIEVVGDAADGVQAVSLVKSLRPDVALMDISMPGSSGIQATQQVLEVSPQTQVIILSMLGDPEDIFWALQAGARGYLLKESAGREVMEAVLAVYSGYIYLSQPVLKTLVADYVQLRGSAVKESPLEQLSQREREILNWVLAGKTSAEIAKILYLSPKTVESYRSRMMRKLGMTDMASLIRFAIQHGLSE
jgi:DNA-binding NarL/FixJ family response regulator